MAISTAKKAAAKPTAKKTTSTRSASATPPAKTAAKKVAPTKRASTKPAENDSEASEKQVDEIFDMMTTWIKEGFFDYRFTALIDAVEEREAVMAEMVRAKKKTEPKPKATAEEKKVPMPTRKTGGKFVPEVGATYVVADGHPLAGAKVSFVGFYKDDENKSKVKMVTDAPGAPVGKGVLVPTNMLKKPVARGGRRPAAKKAAAKK